MPRKITPTSRPEREYPLQLAFSLGGVVARRRQKNVGRHQRVRRARNSVADLEGPRGCRLRGRHIRPMRRKESPRAASPAALGYLCGPLTHTVGTNGASDQGAAMKNHDPWQLEALSPMAHGPSLPASDRRGRCPLRPICRRGSMPPSCCEIVVFDMRTWLPEEALKGFREAGRRAKVATTPRRRAHRNRIPDSRIGLCSIG
jgi:hypothetical protein